LLSIVVNLLSKLSFENSVSCAWQEVKLNRTANDAMIFFMEFVFLEYVFLEYVFLEYVFLEFVIWNLLFGICYLYITFSNALLLKAFSAIPS
jgi:hypothetical protein